MNCKPVIAYSAPKNKIDSVANNIEMRKPHLKSSRINCIQRQHRNKNIPRKCGISFVDDNKCRYDRCYERNDIPRIGGIGVLEYHFSGASKHLERGDVESP